MSVSSSYKLLQAFSETFRGKVYQHRDSTIGNKIAVYLYEDLYDLGRSRKLVDRIDEKRNALNIIGDLTGIRSRRADGTFGERNPSTQAIDAPGFVVARSHLATIEIGIEVKIVCKAMLRQIGRVDSDLRDQVAYFRKGNENPVSVGIVGINHAGRYVSYEGDRPYPTMGHGKHKHPFQEAEAVKARLEHDTKPKFDEFLFLHFKATNEEAEYPFEWLDEAATLREYGAILARISRKYEEKF